MENKMKGYLYSMKTGEMTVREGWVESNPWWPGRNRGNFSGRFYIEGEKDKYVQCTISPGVVYHDVVWLPERCDKYAEDLFVNHEYECIAKLEDEIHKRMVKVERIKNGIS